MHVHIISEKLVSINKLEEFLDMKQKTENKLYSAFLLLLNEKKHRIQYLTEILENRDNTQTVCNGDVKAEPTVENVYEDSDITQSDISETSTGEDVFLQNQSQKRLQHVDAYEPTVSTSDLPKRIRTTVVDDSKQQSSSKEPDAFVTEVVQRECDSYMMSTQEFLDRL